MSELRVGCSGWNYAHWRELVYPKGLQQAKWLERYATLFDTVEVNATFYRLPAVTTVARWVERVPEDFLFAVKMSRFVTHVKRLRDLPPSLELYYGRIEPLARSRKLGPVLWQFPETFRRNDDRLAEALGHLPAGRHCFEFRHASWFADDVYELLRRRGAALVIGDHPQRPFQSHELTADWTFLRFHYGSRGRNGNYSERELEEWAQRIEAWRARVDVYAFFNNDWMGFAVQNGLWLRGRLGA